MTVTSMRLVSWSAIAMTVAVSPASLEMAGIVLVSKNISNKGDHKELQISTNVH